jgi:protein TonB
MTIPKILLVACLLTTSHRLIAQVTPEVQKEDDGKEFKYVEVMPRCPFNVGEYLAEHLKYPKKARKNNIEGRVVASFIVQEDGSLDSIRIIKAIGGGCDEEVIRVIKGMPAWKPGKQNGKCVKVWFNMPVIFKLEH